MARTPIDKATVKRYLAEGLTQAQMVERFYAETGERRGRTAFAVALGRFGLDNPRATPRYEKWLPWRGIPASHYCYEQRMLRALASRELGKPNADALNGRLDHWIEEMDREDLVVMYEPVLGFFKVPREEGDVGYITVKNLVND